MKIQIGNETLETREVKGLLQKRNPTELEIEIVEGAGCPCCGAYDEHPEERLRFPNRPKVEDEGVWWWKCYNPSCDCWYDPVNEEAELCEKDHSDL